MEKLIGNNVGKSPAQTIMLPEEVWDIIFRDLTPHDFHSATLACSEWNQLLNHKKKRILFPIVLPFVVDYLSVQSVLNFRLVSKNFKNIIDNVLQQDGSSSHQKDEKINGRKVQKKSSRMVKIINRRSYSFSVPNRINRFITHFESFPSNPFLTQHISLSGCVLENVERWELNVLSFLAHFGHHILSLDLHTDFENGSRFLYAVKQISLLNYLPNLKILKLSGVVWRKVEVKHLMRLGSLPNLTELICLNVETSSWVVLQLLLQQCGPNLSKFHLRRMFPMTPEINWKKITALVPNVRDFKLVYDNEIVARSFGNLTGIGWQLTRLVIESQTPLNASQFIQIVNQFSNSLVELEILATFEINQVSQLAAVYAEQMSVFAKLKSLKIKLWNVKNWYILSKVFNEKCPNLHEIVKVGL